MSAEDPRHRHNPWLELIWLHGKGWSDARIAVWISDQLGDDLTLGPSSQSVYRWRRGKSSPQAKIYANLIEKLYQTERQNELRQDNQDECEGAQPEGA